MPSGSRTRLTGIFSSHSTAELPASYQGALSLADDVSASVKTYSFLLSFIDTDAMTTLWFSRFLLSESDQIARTESLANAINGISKYDLIFFMEPTVPFVQDGTRNEAIAANRDEYSRQIKELLDGHGMKYICLSGDYAERFYKAKEIINRTFNITEV